MHHEQAKPNKFSCPACSFKIFNRRYKKCERCGFALPVSLLYSEGERRALLAGEEKRLALELKSANGGRPHRKPRRLTMSPTTGIVTLSLAPTSDIEAAYGEVAHSTTDTFASAGGGEFAGGGASGSFESDGGPSNGID